jgi:hypothetical protein
MSFPPLASVAVAALCAVACRSAAPPSADAAPAPSASSSAAVATDLRFVGTVLRIEASTLPQSARNWVVTMRVDRVLEGSLAGAEFAFRVHSPSRAGLLVGAAYPVRATRQAGGWTVDEAQWLARPGP